VHSKLCYGNVSKHSLSAQLVNLLFVTFNLNCKSNAVSVGKPSERMSDFWTVWFLKIESELIFGFPHIPKFCLCTSSCWVVLLQTL